VREAGTVGSQAVLIAIGIDWEGRRNVLGVELANRESASSWKAFLTALRDRGLHGVQVAISDDHAGLRRAIREVLPEATWQRCYVHFLRNALDYLPRKADDDCLMELRWLYDRRDVEEARRDLSAWLGKWAARYPKLCSWVEENIEETLSFYRLPRQHHKNLKSTNMLDHGGDQAPHAGGPHLSEPGQLLTPGAGACCRDARELDRSDPLPEHGTAAGAEKQSPAANGGGGVIAAGFCSVEQRKRPQSPAPSSALHPRSPDRQARNLFAELDTHDFQNAKQLPESVHGECVPRREIGNLSAALAAPVQRELLPAYVLAFLSSRQPMHRECRR
jgi:hypothetical protein